MSREKTVILSLGLLAFLLVGAMVCLLGIFSLSFKVLGPASGNGGTPGNPTNLATGGNPAAGSTGNAGSAAGLSIDTLLTLATEPPQATVLLDGRVLGASPIRSVPVAAGVHSLRLERDGYEPKVLAVEFRQSETVLNETLTPVAFAQLTVVSDPAGAEVLIDGEFLGRTPLTLAALKPGPHELQVSKANYTTHQSVQILRPGEKKEISDLRLENKLLLMLEALLEQDQRSIGNWMELAHFYYINNEMRTAARYFTRARELAAQPPPAETPEMTEGEREALQNEAQWDRSKLMGEIRKHLQQGPSYYGSELDYKAFQEAYAEEEKKFARWQTGWRDLGWVENEAFALSLKGNYRRAKDLFGDYVTAVNGDSGAGWGGLVKVELILGDLSAAEQNYVKAKTGLQKFPAPPEEMRFREITWLDLAKGWAIAAFRAPQAGREPMLARAEECLTALEKIKGLAALIGLEAQRVRGQLLRLRGQTDLRLQVLRAADARAAELLNALSEHSPDRRFVIEERERVQLQIAWAELAAGNLAAARERVHALAAEPTQAADVLAAATAFAAALAKGETPAEPPVTALGAGTAEGDPKTAAR